MSNYEMRDYVDVAERIREFRKIHPNGSLQPFDPAEPFKIVTIGDRMFLVYTACAYRTPDDPRPGIAVAWEPAIGKTPFTRDSELMNAETSAWGRAIMACLAADAKRIASADEVRNRRADQESAPIIDAPAPKQAEVGSAVKPNNGTGKPTDKQIKFLRSLISQTGTDAEIVCALVDAENLDALSWQQAKNAIDDLLRI